MTLVCFEAFSGDFNGLNGFSPLPQVNGSQSPGEIKGELTRVGASLWLSGKEFACNARDLGLLSGLERSP